MPGNKKNKKYVASDIRNNRIAGLKFEVKSQVNEEIYKKLQDNNKLPDFIACIKYCSSKEYTIERTCEVLNKQFAFYIKDNEMKVDTFKSLISLYAEINDAWGYGTCGTFIDLQKVRDKANEIIQYLPVDGGEKYNPINSMKTIEIYHKLYDKDYIERNSKEQSNQVNISVDNSSKQTKDTEDLIMKSLNSIKLVPDKGDDNNGVIK